MNNNKEYELYSLRVLQTMAKERGLEYDGNEIDIIIRLKSVINVMQLLILNLLNVIIVILQRNKFYQLISQEV
jgi:hypothetical protein